MKQKFILDLKVVSVERLNEKNVLIKLTHDAELPDMKPGQFVEVRVDGSASTYLRRPISINFVDKERNELWLLVAEVGDGTRTIAAVKSGDTLNCVLPLGNGFTYPVSSSDSLLLIGGGVGSVIFPVSQRAVLEEKLQTKSFPAALCVMALDLHWQQYLAYFRILLSART